MTPRVRSALVKIAEGLRELAEEDGGTAATPDELTPYPFGFERRAASALVHQGKLPTTKIGRRIYARRSDLLALVGNAAKVRPTVAPAASDPATAARHAYAATVRPLRVVQEAR